jgi:hypothetical protein
MATPTFFQNFALDLALKQHNLDTDTLKITLCSHANIPNYAADSKLADLTPISMTNLPAVTLNVPSVAQVGGLLTVIIDDFNVLASGGSVGPFRHVVIYNDTSTNDSLIVGYDIGAEITLLDTQQITLDFDPVNGAIFLSPI